MYTNLLTICQQTCYAYSMYLITHSIKQFASTVGDAISNMELELTSQTQLFAILVFRNHKGMERLLYMQ